MEWTANTVEVVVRRLPSATCHDFHSISVRAKGKGTRAKAGAYAPRRAGGMLSPWHEYSNIFSGQPTVR